MYIGFWALKLMCTQYGLYWTRQLSRMQRLFFLKSGGVGWGVFPSHVLPKGCRLWASAIILSWDPFFRKLVGGTLTFAMILSQCHLTISHLRSLNFWMLMQPKMSHHLMFWYGLRSTRWQSMWMEGINRCKVVPTSYSEHVGIFVSLEVLVLGIGPMSCPNLGAKLWANIFHIWCPIWMACFPPLDMIRLCTTWPNGYGKKIHAHVAYYQSKGEYLKMSSCDPTILRMTNCI